ILTVAAKLRNLRISHLHIKPSIARPSSFARRIACLDEGKEESDENSKEAVTPKRNYNGDYRLPRRLLKPTPAEARRLTVGCT
ncbi:hypothetical protein AK812_SmicGene47355, partial [Symbiodinium microadriaticum]